jgi:hypothetical protein
MFQTSRRNSACDGWPLGGAGQRAAHGDSLLRGQGCKFEKGLSNTWQVVRMALAVLLIWQAR